MAFPGSSEIRAGLVSHGAEGAADVGPLVFPVIYDDVESVLDKCHRLCCLHFSSLLSLYTCGLSWPYLAL